MRKKRVINWMVILSILLTGCKQKKDTLQTLLPPLVKAEHIMYEYPDSALHILQEMQMPASSDKLQKATCIIRKSKFPQNPKRSVRFSGKRTKRSVQKRKARNTQKAETKVL